LTKFRAGEIDKDSFVTQKASTGGGKYRIFPATPKEFQTEAIVLLKTLVLVIISGYLEVMTNGTVSKYVWCLLVGVLGAELGFIERKPLDVSRSFGLFITIIMMFVFAGLKSVSLDILKQIAFDFAILISLSTAGIALVSIPVGRAIGLSKAMSFAIGLGSIAGGFPASFVLSNESAKLQAENEDEFRLLLDHFLPKTLVSGFVSATSGSVIIAGLFAKMFFN
jgi:Na+/glutamate symporter